MPRGYFSEGAAILDGGGVLSRVAAPGAGARIPPVMTRTADVVVIGGGANGTSTAFHLALLGVRNVLVLERRHLAAGATCKSGRASRLAEGRPWHDADHYGGERLTVSR